jgi:hypothetical protein
MIPKMPAPVKAGVADFSDKIMRKIKENREHFRFNLIEKRSNETADWICQATRTPTISSAVD